MRAGRLKPYHEKRDFAVTPEPRGEAGSATGDLFVVQKHDSRRLHYDLRLQFGEVLKSWAVTKGPSLDPSVRRLAVHVEDHPLDYADFEGEIPKGAYGAGQVIVWDRGIWTPMGDPEAGYRKGNLKFRLAGEKLAGGWALVRMKGEPGKPEPWLLIKERDLYARPESEGDLLRERPESVLSGRRLNRDAPAERRPALPRRRLAPARLPGAKKAPPPAKPGPQLASRTRTPPAGAGWLHEIKFDGYRTLACLDGARTRFLTRTGLDWTKRYGALAEAFAGLPCKQAIIDGEVVVQDETGHSSFAALQDALSKDASERLLFFAFDLVYLDGYDLSAVRLLARKEALQGLLEARIGAHSALQISEHVLGKGAEFWAQACRAGLEGVISKKLDAPYRAGRTKSWLKAKCTNRDDFLIVGYSESEAAGGLGALLLGEASPQGPRYVGKVGTGFSAAAARKLLARLRELRQDKAAVRFPESIRAPRGARWVAPALLAEVQFGDRTSEGLLRHSVFVGLREDKAAPPAEAAPRRRLVSDAHLAAVSITNPDRVMFGGPSKLDIALYYARIGDWMLPELIDRPLTLLRCPEGSAADCFYQRHAGPGTPGAIQRIAVREEGERARRDFLYITGADGLLALAQFGVVEFHPWGCRVDKVERPDRMIFDLDPDEGLRWREVVRAAGDLRARLEDLGLVPFVKTTGGKGLHVVVPLLRRHTWAAVRGFSEALAAAFAKAEPNRFTAQPSKRSRRGRIYIDFLRNGRGATAVGAYSLRARPGVPVALPLSWDELAGLDDPRALDYAAVPDLVAKRPDPWGELDRQARALSKDMERRLRAGC